MGTAAGIAGAAIQTVGAFGAASSAEDAAEHNAALGREHAAGIRDQTTAEIATQRQGFRRFLSGMRGDIAGHGGSAKSGTGLELIMEAARQAKLSELNIGVQGENRARAAEAGADIDVMEGRGRGRSLRLGGLASAIRGANEWAQLSGQMAG